MKAKPSSRRPWLSLYLLVSLALTACNGATTTSTPTSYNGHILHILLNRSTTLPTQQQQWMQQIGNEFHQTTGATIAWDTYSSSNEEQTRLQTSVVSGSGPDIFSLGTSFVPTAQATKGFTILSDQDWKTVGGKDRFFKPQLSMSGASPNQLIAVPWLMRPFAMVYNTELFRKAGITAPPTTWTDFVEDAKKMTDAHAGVYGAEMDPADTFNTWKIWWMFNEQLGGGNFLSPDYKTVQMNTPTAVKAVQFWFDWVATYKIVDPNAMTWNAADALRAFSNGKVGMLIMITSTVTPTLQNSLVNGKYAFAPMPTIPYGLTQRPANGNAASTIISGDMLAVADYSTEKALAFKFIGLVTDYQHQLQWSRTFGDLPANVAAATELAQHSQQTSAFIQAEQDAMSTPFSGVWGSLEVALAGISSKLASEVATNQYAASHIKPLLDQANTQIQGQVY